MIVWLCAIFLIFLLVYSTRVILHRHRSGLPFPPGPRGFPLVGNALDFPTSNVPSGFHDLAKRYGPLVHLRILGRSIIIADSYDAACELLNKKSKSYAGRPDSVMTRLALLSDFLPMMSYGQSLIHRRRIFNQTLRLSLVNSRYRRSIQRVTHSLLLDLLEKPQAFSHHISHAFAASVLSVGYGIDISGGDEHYRDMLQQTTELIEDVVVPGKYLVELFPVLQHLPGWFPGAGFKRDANVVREKVLDARRTLYEEGKSLLRAKPTGNSMLAMMLQRIATLEGDAAAEEEEHSASALIETYIGGSATTVVSLRAFFLVMAMYPDAQRQAQAELDRVIGRTRLPDCEDRASLPYINAVVKELTRWHVVAPMGLPHAALEDDECNSFYIPKGSIVIANAWAISRDPGVYPDPETFNPDRFLRDGELYAGALDPSSYIFGFGRRICTGRHFADVALFLTCASTLHAFNISPPLDNNGTPIKLEAEVVTDRAIAHLKEFECMTKPRWAGVADLIRS